MNAQEIRDKREKLGRAALDRYREREAPRTRKFEEIREKGVLGAAGMTSALRRCAHMSQAEGSSILSETAPLGPPAPAAAEGTPEARPSGRGGRTAERTLEAITGGFDDSDNINFLAR